MVLQSGVSQNIETKFVYLIFLKIKKNADNISLNSIKVHVRFKSSYLISIYFFYMLLDTTQARTSSTYEKTVNTTQDTSTLTVDTTISPGEFSTYIC